MIELKGKNEEELKDFFISIEEKPFRGQQLFQWIYEKKESDFSKMTNLSKDLRDKLKEVALISDIEIVQRSISENKNTEKYLFKLSDGNHIESVIMRYEKNLGPGRVTACISTQVGCALKCSFCASGCSGLIRNLSKGEIADQVIQMQKALDASGERIANVVIMGIGEPLSNYENLIQAVRLIKNPQGIGIGHKHITISTCGLVPQIIKLAGEDPMCKLAISLHAYSDEIRSKLMPINKKYNLKRLLEACKYYQKVTDTRITFEYILIDRVNSSITGAKKLGKLLKDISCIVNLIPLNPVDHFPYSPPSEKTCRAFAGEVEKFGIKATLRQERGKNIDAACGQLRVRYEGKR